MARAVTVKVKGLDKLQRQLKATPEAVLEAQRAGLYEEANDIMADSKEYYVPIFTGNLKGSGFVEPPEVSPMRNVRVNLGYGGAAAPYAIHVHETNKQYRNGKTWKYLEIPFNLAKNQMSKRMMWRITQHLKRIIQ